MNNWHRQLINGDLRRQDTSSKCLERYKEQRMEVILILGLTKHPETTLRIG